MGSKEQSQEMGVGSFSVQVKKKSVQKRKARMILNKDIRKPIG